MKGASDDDRNKLQSGREKPRRLEDETAEYLAQIEVQFSSTDSMDEESKRVMVENVLSEISNRLASVATDRRTNYLLEKMIDCAPDAKMILAVCVRLEPYVIFLARNRYSSHILQSIIARVCYIIKYEEYSEECSADALSAALLALMQPLVEETCWLIREQSASHVLRSVYCLLAGMPVIAEKKGKNSKHQHAVSLAEPLDSLKSTEYSYIDQERCFPVPDGFHDLLVQSVDRLVKLSAADLETLLADFSSSAVLSFLLRILCNPSILEDTVSEGTSTLIHSRRLLGRAFNWPQLVTTSGETALSMTAGGVPESTKTVFYSMAGDRAGSYFLEAAIECSEIQLMVALVGSSLGSNARDYASDKCGNFVVQAVLRRYSMELKRQQQQQQLSKKMQQAAAVVEQQVQSICDQLTTDAVFFRELVTTKGGVIYWMLEAVKHLPSAVAASDLSERISNSLIDTWITTPPAAAINSGEEQQPLLSSTEVETDRNGRIRQFSNVLSVKLIASSKDTAAIASAVTVPSSSTRGPTKGKKTESKDTARSDSTQLLVAKLVGQLIESPSSEIASIASAAFAGSSIESLLYVATSGPVSRAVLDIFFKKYRQSVPLKILSSSLCSSGVQIAQHYVGQHVLRQAYESSDVRGKEKWAMLLTANRDELLRNKEGRNSLHLVNFELYQRDAAEWRSAVKRKVKAESLLMDMTTDSAAVTTTAGGVRNGLQKRERGPAAAVEEQQLGKRKEASEYTEAPVADDSPQDENAISSSGIDRAAGRKRKRKRVKKPTEETPDDRK